MYSREGRNSARRERGEALLTELGRTARWGGQEIELEALDDGWQLRIFSCYTTDHDEEGFAVYRPSDEIIIKIPSDSCEAPTIREVIHERP